MVIEGLVVWILTAGGLGIGSPEAHPMSRSSSRVDLEEGLVRWSLRVQCISVLEVLPGLDLDGDGELARAEADAGAEAIAVYLGAHYGVRDVEELAGEWSGELVRIGAPLEPDRVDRGEWIEAVWEVKTDGEVQGIGVRMELFEATSPDHIDVFELRRGGRLAYTGLFGAALPGVWIPDAGGEGVAFLDWVGWGIVHILTGYDHLAFLLALLVCVGGFRHTAVVVTAFTVAHSLTLGLAAMEVVSLPGRFVELVIALSISFVAFGGFAEKPRKGLWLEAMLFGLVHGLGFAGFLGDALIGEERRFGALLGFNLGVELGQLLFLAPLAMVLVILRRRGVDSGEWWVPERPRKVVSGCVVIAGLVWFVQRAGWLG